MTNEHSEQWLKQITQELDAHEESLDYKTQLRLKQAREHAIQQGAVLAHKRKHFPKYWFAGAVFASFAAIFIVSNTFMPHNSQGMAEPTLFEDIELLAAEEDLELLEQLEFYEWLESDGAGDELES